MKRFILHLAITYGLGVAVGVVGMPVGVDVLEGAGVPVGAGVLVGKTAGVAVWTPWMENTRSTTSPNAPKSPKSCWLK
jgi:hypothetical protein